MQSMLFGEQVSFLEELYEKYRTGSPTLDKEWADFFRALETQPRIFEKVKPAEPAPSLLQEMGVQNLLNTYRRLGHRAANLDPLGLAPRNRDMIEERLSQLSERDLNSEFDTNIPGLGVARLRDVVAWFEKIYCGTIGSEHFYLVDDQERLWLQQRIETGAFTYELSTKERLRIYEKLFAAEYFERFLAKKYVGKKRFSLEGGETLIPMLDQIVEEAGASAMEGIVIGMAHRGRLNVLQNILRKPSQLIFAEFEEKADVATFDDADVKYHLGYSNIIKTESGKDVKLSLMFNPSHLEAVNPVALGSVRARQNTYGDEKREKFMGVLIHGDAAFVGQGVVAETLNLMYLEGFTTGGTIHIVVNNQVGFTTEPHESRSTLYATDLAKGFQIPIFHVNGDDPEAAVRVVKLAMDYRKKFRKDVIIDLICYRRLGHNETDEPSFTQPRMYEVIKNHPTTVAIYRKQLLEIGVREKDLTEIENSIKDALEQAHRETSEKNISIQVDSMRGIWQGFSRDFDKEDPPTGVSRDILVEIARKISEVPPGFTVHPKLEKWLESRRQAVEQNLAIDWALAEALAFGSLLVENYNIRFSGQDAQRGTFSQRHAVLVDYRTGKRYVPLAHIRDKQGWIRIINSPLSEYAVLGFEYGYSLSAPRDMVIWEAQFGDFANGAQIVIDQFLSSSEVKWNRLSGLILLLPHGYEGQGPEHSSARLERFLQLCAKKNMVVCYPTTPAQYFHLLRRQVLRKVRKPLIIMTPKSLLRLAEASSHLEEFEQGSFQEILGDRDVRKEEVTRLIFCTGKIYYDLTRGRQEKGLKHIAIHRLEQLYPLRHELLDEAVKSYPSLKEVFWAQEEPRNMGSWAFVKERWERTESFRKFPLNCVARKTSPSPAAGLTKVHAREQAELIEKALS
ncbi:MAG: 2-oxoglutarate dehydrogenase E1 component [Leptospiraceae bacterium]|nr:2-oxoglutarate dehydrogenase E1 component [Leptospiraceae bacterium]MDW8306850.1 2-oxoglutarate dehydrogenase E1 component [Leptospiraceae bacterium]